MDKLQSVIVKYPELLRVHPIVYRFSHHSSYSGYDILRNYLGHPIACSPLPTWSIPNRLLWRIANGMILYDRMALALELKASWHAINHSKRLYHVLYGENYYKYLAVMAGFRGNKVVASFHQPPEILAQHLQIAWPLRKLAAIIILGNSQKKFFQKFVPDEKIHFIPYAVDTDFFVPPSQGQIRQDKQVLVVGNWLRDFDLLKEIIQKTLTLDDKVRFTIVSLSDNLGQFRDLPVELLSGISDERLRKLYQSAQLLLLPLRDCVANTALLEAMACGLPILASDVGSIRDYAGEDNAVFIPERDATLFVNEINNLFGNPQQLSQMSQASYQRSLSFSWPNIVDKMMKVYQAAGLT